MKFQNGELTPEEYDSLMRKSSLERRILKKELNDMGVSFMMKHFSKNPNEINLDMILEYAKKQIN